MPCRRYTDILAPYKYAGYPQLLQTIELEKDDDNLFSKPYPLLPAARCVPLKVLERWPSSGRA